MGSTGSEGFRNYGEWIKRHETSDANYKRAVKFWKKQCAAGYSDVLRAFDCSGLGMYWLQNVSHILKNDCNANTLYGKCKKIGKADIRIGDFVFHINSTTRRATHIGYVVDTDKNVIEALGRDVGVVKRPFDKGKWVAFGRPPFWTEDEVRELIGEPQPEPVVDPDEFVFRRVLKYGCVGDDVCELKILLRGAGYDNLTIGNRNYYSKTKKTVKVFQKAHSLKVDGKAGPETIAALGGTFKAD